MVDNWKLPHGDITPKDEREFESLNNLYAHFVENREHIANREQAKCLLVFAHGYLMLGIEDAADKYFEESGVICPQYLDDFLKEDMDRFPELDKACRDLAEWYNEKFKGQI